MEYDVNVILDYILNLMYIKEHNNFGKIFILFQQANSYHDDDNVIVLMKMLAQLASFWIRNVKHAYILKTNYPMSGKIKLLESCLYIKKNHSVMECSPGLIFAFYFLIGQ